MALDAKLQQGPSVRRKLVIITNTPTPYRNHLYRHLWQTGDARGIDVEIWFQMRRERGRPWAYRRQDLDYPCRFLPSVTIPMWPIPLLWNPGLLGDLLKTKPWHVILGGYTSIAAPALSVLARHQWLPVSLWSEGCDAFTRSSLLRRYKQWIVRGFGSFVVPGKLAREFIEDLRSTREQPPIFVPFPNVVDETKYAVLAVERRRSSRINALRKKWQVPDGALALISPMRLEWFKDPLTLCGAIEKANIPHLLLLVAGEGSLRTRIEQTDAFQRGQVRLLGQRSEAEMLELYMLADAFILASRYDSYPLSAIEAAWAGLPFILSDHVGCYPEVLGGGENGFVFPAGDMIALVGILQTIATLPGDCQLQMGRSSHVVARQGFSTRSVVETLFDGLESMSVTTSNQA